MNDVVEKTLQLQADRNRVWKALTDPAELSMWFPDRTDLEPRAGATGWFDWTVHGKYAVRVEEVRSAAATRLDVGQGCGCRRRGGPADDGRVDTRSPAGWRHVRCTCTRAGSRYRDGNDEGWNKELGELITYLQPVRPASPARP